MSGYVPDRAVKVPPRPGYEWDYQTSNWIRVAGPGLSGLEKPEDWAAGNSLVKAPTGQAGGLKYDAGKTQWSLLLSAKGVLAAVTGVVQVLMFGAKKYAAHSWREVEDNERRYLDGLMRHYAAIMEHGITAVDEESGLLHIDHLNCNGLFLGEIARKVQDANA